MALSAKLAMRQGQTMVLTPQLLQAIKLLQMPYAELSAFIESELERNPLLDRAEDRETEAPAEPNGVAERADGDWASDALETDVAAMAANLGTEIENAFDTDRAAPAASPAPSEGLGLSATSWTGTGGSGGGTGDEAPDLEAYVAESLTLREHLTRQAALLFGDPRDLLIGLALIDGLDESGYFLASLDEIAEKLGVSTDKVEATLLRMQGLEPTGIFARGLAECLALQLIERDRFDPAMRALIDNLPVLAKRDYPALRRVCGVDDEDLRDMIGEIRRLEPKPGRAFGEPIGPAAIPDVFVTAAPDQTWRIELNSEALPRVLVNEVYAARIRSGGARESDKQYISTHLQSANWLTKSLEQRARTILNVASEIVRRQDAFLVEGVSALRPLNLKMVAEAIGVHESTVSRATSNKYIQTPRGLFEMKYFFTTSIASSVSSEGHSAEAVRQKIRQMIDAENPDDVLSDDVIVTELKKADIVVARRTVAKYRESLRIPSSVDRRRMKALTVRSAERSR